MTVSCETGAWEAFQQSQSVSRETLARLTIHADMLRRWQTTINLVSTATLPSLWERHFLDSAQLTPRLPPGPVLDMGAGAGFPGLVLAILGDGRHPVHLVESDTRKCSFLRAVAQATQATVVIHNTRVETLTPFPVAAITARALAPLSQLLEWCEPFLAAGTECLFPKGRLAEDELTVASKNWKMTAARIPSLSDPAGVIFHLREVHRG